MLGQGTHQRMAAMSVDGAGRAGALEKEVGRPSRSMRCSRDWLGEVVGRQAGAVGILVERGAEELARAAHEALDVGRAAEHGGGLVPFGQHVLGPEAALGEEGARGAGAFCCALCQSASTFLSWLSISGRSRRSWRVLPPEQQHRLHDRLHDLVGVGRQRHRTPSSLRMRSALLRMTRSTAPSTGLFSP